MESCIATLLYGVPSFHGSWREEIAATGQVSGVIALATNQYNPRAAGGGRVRY